MKTILFTALFFTLFSTSFASLRVTLLDPQKPSPIDSFVEHKMAVLNENSQDIALMVKRQEILIPEGWNVSMCLDLCLPDFIKSEKWSIPADSQKIMSIDIQASSIAEAKLDLQFIDESNDSLLESISLSYPSSEAITPLITPPHKSPILFRQNAQGSYVDFPNFSQFTLQVFNSHGQQLIHLSNQKTDPNNQYFLNLPKLSLTPHFILISTQNQTFQLPFIPLN